MEDENEVGFFNIVGPIAGNITGNVYIGNQFENHIRNKLATQSYDSIVHAGQTGVIRNSNDAFGTIISSNKFADGLNKVFGKFRNYNVSGSDSSLVSSNIYEKGLGFQSSRDSRIAKVLQDKFKGNEDLLKFAGKKVTQEDNKALRRLLYTKFKEDPTAAAELLGKKMSGPIQEKTAKKFAREATETVVDRYASGKKVSKFAIDHAGVNELGFFKNAVRPAVLIGLAAGAISAASSFGQSSAVENYNENFKRKLTGASTRRDSSEALNVSQKHRSLSYSNDDDYMYILRNKNVANDTLNSLDTYSYTNTTTRTIV